MKKSLLVTLYFPPVRGGISNSLWNICSHLPSDKITVLTEPSQSSLRTNFKVYRKRILKQSKFIWPKWIFLLYDIKKIIKKEHVQLLQAGQILPIGTVALLAKFFYRIPYIVYVYGQDLVIQRRSKIKMCLVRKILKYAQTVVTNSNYTKQKALKLSSSEGKTIVVYPSPQNNIDLNVDQHYLDYFVEHHNLIGKKVILSVGNLVKRKGYDKMIEALPSVIKKVPNVQYVIVGNGPFRKELESLIKQHDVGNYVKIFDKVTDDELAYYYKCCHVFSMPSRSLKNKYGETIDVEGFGMVYLEANLFGKSVIGGNSGGVPEAIKHNVSGLVIDPNNVNELARSLIILLTNDKFAAKMGAAGKEYARKNFRWEQEVKKINEILK